MKKRKLPPGIEDNEVFIVCGDHETLMVFSSHSDQHDGVSYVRFVDPRGVEIVFYNSHEWKVDPEGTMGAILGCLKSGPGKVPQRS